jgi:hypothetical protein
MSDNGYCESEAQTTVLEAGTLSSLRLTASQEMPRTSRLQLSCKRLGGKIKANSNFLLLHKRTETNALAAAETPPLQLVVSHLETQQELTLSIHTNPRVQLYLAKNLFNVPSWFVVFSEGCSEGNWFEWCVRLVPKDSKRERLPLPEPLYYIWLSKQNEIHWRDWKDRYAQRIPKGLA